MAFVINSLSKSWAATTTDFVNLTMDADVDTTGIYSLQYSRTGDVGTFAHLKNIYLTSGNNVSLVRLDEVVENKAGFYRLKIGQLTTATATI